MQIPFRYVSRDTFVHRLHPLVKILHMVLTLLLILAPMYDIRFVPVPATWLAMSVIWWILARIELNRFGALLKLLMGTFTFLMIIQGFTYRHGTTTIIKLFTLQYGTSNIGEMTLEGVYIGLMLSVRIFTAAASLPLLMMTTSSADLMTALRKLRLPKVATFMIVSALSFTTLIFEMWASIMSAQKLRAFDIDRMNLVEKMRRAYVPIVTPLVLLLFRKANDFQIALETRGFGTPGDPTEVMRRPFKVVDGFMVVLLVLLFAFCHFLRIQIAGSIG